MDKFDKILGREIVPQVNKMGGTQIGFTEISEIYINRDLIICVVPMKINSESSGFKITFIGGQLIYTEDSAFKYLLNGEM